MDRPNANLVFLFNKQSRCRMLLTVRGNKMTMLTVLQFSDINIVFKSADPDDFYSKFL